MARPEFTGKIGDALLRLFRIQRVTTENREERVRAMADLFSKAEGTLKIVTDGEELKEIAKALERAGIIDPSQSEGTLIDNSEE